MPQGSPYTYVGNADKSNQTNAIQTSQGIVQLGSWGYFLPSEYQSAIGQGLLLTPGQSGPGPTPGPSAVAYLGSDGTVGGPGGSPLANPVNLVAQGILPTLASVGHPTTGLWTADQAVIDSSGVVWVCTATGTPGTWQQGAGGSTSNVNGGTP